MPSFLCSMALAAACAAEPPSPFGIGSCHINGRTLADHERWLPQIAALGVRNLRTPHTSWGALEPAPGQWRWEELDAQVADLDRRGFEYSALLLGNPPWNRLDPPGNLPVNNLAGWSKYVGEVARRLRGKVRRLEVWNEPPNFTGKDQTPADYAKLVVAAHRAAKAVDPRLRIGLAAKSAHVQYLEQTILAGAKGHYDDIILHPYEVLDGVAEHAGSEAVFLHIAPTVRRMLAARDPAQAAAPIVFTELGVDARKGLATQAHGLVKAYALAIAQGVETVHWFEGRDGDSGPMGLLDARGKPRPAHRALGEMLRRFGPRPRPAGWTTLGGRAHVFVFEGAEGLVAAAWGSAGSNAPADFGGPARFVDPLTGVVETGRTRTLGAATAFVLDLPPALAAEARANLGKPYPWGGDFSAAREVSIDYSGPAPAERGLHTRAGAAVAKAVVAYGGNARAGDVPGGNAFIVDPNFLCYDPVPIEIEATVRRNAKNDNAGFKLVYESPSGFKTAGGWRTIPDNQAWHTFKWRIDDPQFVNYWGYNFVLESDGPRFGKYLLKNVAVRKLPR